MIAIQLVISQMKNLQIPFTWFLCKEKCLCLQNENDEEKFVYASFTMTKFLILQCYDSPVCCLWNCVSVGRNYFCNVKWNCFLWLDGSWSRRNKNMNIQDKYLHQNTSTYKRILKLVAFLTFALKIYNLRFKKHIANL